MKIFSASQVKEIDRYTIRHEPLASIELMERAAKAFCQRYQELFPRRHQRIRIFCGPGNNGGDGLAITRLLADKGHDTEAFLLKIKDTGSDDFEENRKQLIGLRPMHEITQASQLPTLHPDDVVIDALFGSGLSRPVEGLAAETIRHINAASSGVVSVDIASGLYADRSVGEGAIVEPDYTISFQFPKLAFLIPENYRYVGNWSMVNIRLHPDAIEQTETPYHYLTAADISAMLLPRAPFSHKGTFGHALLAGGSHGKIGALQLAARACAHAGVGLVTVLVPGCGYSVVQTAVPEAMALVSGDHHLTDVPDLSLYSAVGIGPGMGQHPESRAALEKLLRTTDQPLIIDADALNLLATHPPLLPYLPPSSVLTPHPGEFTRLGGESSNHFERLDRLRAFAAEHRVVCVLKGRHTAIATPGGTVYFNSTGNPGMATGGTGDVLTGIIAALRAQGYALAAAAAVGVYVHGLAGDLAAEAVGPVGLTASELIRYLGRAFQQLTPPQLPRLR